MISHEKHQIKKPLVDSRVTPNFRPLAIIGIAWFVIAWLAIDRYGNRAELAMDVRAAHISIVMILWSVVATCCVLVGNLALPFGKARFAIASIFTAAHYVLILYYALVFISIDTWNQLVTSELILGYIGNIPELMKVLPISPFIQLSVVFLPLAVLFACYWSACASFLRSVRGLWGEARGTPRGMVFALTPVAAAWTLLLSQGNGWGHYLADLGEPITQTFLTSGKPLGSMTMHMDDPIRQHRDRQIETAYSAVPPRRPKNLIVIMVDALRPDQMHVYGHPRENTPFLSMLYREGKLTRFDNAYSVCTDSFCGLLAVLTSKYWYQVSFKNFSIVDVLKKIGYQTHFFLSGDHTNYYGLKSYYGNSIDDYKDGSSASGYSNDDRYTVNFLRELAPVSSAPQFIFMHLMSVHFLGAKIQKYRIWEPSVFRSLPLGINEEMIVGFTNRYHNSVLQADEMIANIFDALDRKKMLDNAIVVITSDHGELLGEHGRLLHAKFSPVEQLVRIPLLVYDSEGFRYPARPFAVLVDIAPTLLDRIGTDVPAHWAGESLARDQERAFSVVQSGENYAVIGEIGGSRYKYYRGGDSMAEQLFDLRKDPWEDRPIKIPENEAIAKELSAYLLLQVPVLRRR